MSKELKNITESVMDQIHEGKIKMKPKIYFIIGSILTFIGLTFSIIISIFLVGLTRFSIRAHGPMSQYRLDQILSNFPWWIIILAIISLIIGIWLIRQYDFSYKKETWMIVLGFILSIIIAGWAIDMIGLNNTLLQRGPMKGMMRNYIQENNIRNLPYWKK
jgi:uncharacterized membrane protein